MTTTEFTGAEEVAWDLSDLYEGGDDPRIEQDVEQTAVLGVDPPGGLRAHSLTTRMVRRERSLAPRTSPPWASESAM